MPPREPEPSRQPHPSRQSPPSPPARPDDPPRDPVGSGPMLTHRAKGPRRVGLPADDRFRISVAAMDRR
jgi:hypothetical protein